LYIIKEISERTGVMDIQNLAAWGEFLGGIGGVVAAA